MAREIHKDKIRELQRKTEIERLREFEHEAVLSRTKLGPRDRLKAAYHLTRAWNKANKAGLRKADFQEVVFERLRTAHGRRQEFRLTNWTLRRGENPLKQDLTESYQGKSTPQKALEPYLTGIAIAAEHCEADPDDWKLDMMRDLSVWSQPTAQLDVTPQDDRPAETLAILLNALCENLARKNRLGATFDAVRRMSCRWEMFEERLVPVTNGTTCMEAIDSPISPVCEESLYFEEMFPFPSIPLLYVPYLVAKAEFDLAPEKNLSSEDNDYMNVGAAMLGNRYNIPKETPGFCRAEGKLIWFRELRLCLVPDGHGGFSSAIETRPRVEIDFENEKSFAGRHHVLGGHDPALERGLFYAQAADGGHVWPYIRDKNGEAWRLHLVQESDDARWAEHFRVRDPETTGWQFDPDPVRHPGSFSSEPWYLSYTPATAPYLRYWLTGDWRLGDEPGVCPWNRSNFDTADPQYEWTRNLPAIHELNFPDFSSATWVECCLHNDLIMEALQASIDRLKQQTGALQAEWHQARERHSNALLVRWKKGAQEQKD